MKQKSWWAYIPDVCEKGVIVDAYTLEEAERIASTMLMMKNLSIIENLVDEEALWSLDMDPREFYMYELGPLHHCNFTEGEEE